MNTLTDSIRNNFNERYDEVSVQQSRDIRHEPVYGCPTNHAYPLPSLQLRKRWGGGVVGSKSRAAKAKQERLRAKEMAQKQLV